VSAAAGGHPSDADRELAARPVLEAALRAAAEGDREALAECYDDEVVWLEAGGAVRGREAAVERHLALAARGAEWAPPQQQGAKAALRWAGDGPARGAIVVEVRRGRIVFAASVP
jgi:hypothetical protein